MVPFGRPGGATFGDFRDFLGAFSALLGAPAPDVAPGRDPRVSGGRFGSLFGRFVVDFGSIRDQFRNVSGPKTARPQSPNSPSVSSKVRPNSGSVSASPA